MQGEIVPISGIGCLASPFHLIKTINKVSNNVLLDRALAKIMKKTFKEHLHEPLFLKMLQEKGIDPDYVLQSVTTDEYNGRYSVVLGGYKDLVEWKEFSSSYKQVKHINIPTLSINSTDDPIIP